MDVIVTEGLRKSFGRIPALDGLTLSVAEGSVFGFLGPNGAGKTTTIRILVGLARAAAGRATVAGIDTQSHPERLGWEIGYLPEEPSFFTWMSPREFLDYVGQIFRLRQRERANRTRELLELVGLTDVARRRIGGFSRGMRQRLGIAQALVNRPRVLFLDEPVSALDPMGRKEVLDLIARLSGQCTVFLSSHILADVERVCDTVGIIAQGRLVVSARKDDLLARYAMPAFEVELEPGGEEGLRRWAEGLRGLPWVRSVASPGLTARIVVDDIARAQRELLPLLLQAGGAIVRYEMVRPSLEEVFLQLVGDAGGAP